MIFDYDKRGIIVNDRITIDNSATGDYYNTFLAKKLRPGMSQNGVSILHDDARPHIKKPVIALLEKY